MKKIYVIIFKNKVEDIVKVKDVVKVIDELSYRDTEEDLRINVDKLKAIITGAN